MVVGDAFLDQGLLDAGNGGLIALVVGTVAVGQGERRLRVRDLVPRVRREMRRVRLAVSR